MKKLICIFIFLCLTAFDINAAELKIVAEDYPPFEYKEDGQVRGFTVEIIQILLSKTGHQGKFHILSWARAEKTALEEENVLIHTLTRSEKRENQYKWVGPLAPRELYFFKLREREDIQINVLEDAKKYTAGTVTGQSATGNLIAKGFAEGKHIFSVPRDLQNVRKLYLGRIDLICMIEPVFYSRIKNLDLERGKVEKVFLIDGSREYFMAFSKQTSDKIVHQFREALDIIKQDGTFQKIKAKYF